MPAYDRPPHLNPAIAEVRAWARWRLLVAVRDPANDELFATGSWGPWRSGGDYGREGAESVGQGEPRMRLSTLLAQQKAHAAAVAPKYVRTRLQEVTKTWLCETEFNVMMTLTFAEPEGVSYALASKVFGQFLPRLRDVVLRKGTRNKRIPMVPLIEDSFEQLREQGLTMEGREGTHIHVLLRLRGDDPFAYKDKIAKAWRATNRLCGDPKVYCPNSNDWFVWLKNGELREVYTDYMLKKQATDTFGLLLQYMQLD